MGQLTLFFDRCVGLRVPKALRIVRPPVVVKDHQQVGFDGNTPDDEWLAKVGQKGWVVVTQDRKFHKQEAEIAAVHAHGVRCFYLHGGSDPAWTTFRNLVIALPRIIDLAEREPAPFIYQAKRGHIRRVKA